MSHWPSVRAGPARRRGASDASGPSHSGLRKWGDNRRARGARQKGRMKRLLFDFIVPWIEKVTVRTVEGRFGVV